jgi:hypothetical protein
MPLGARPWRVYRRHFDRCYERGIGVRLLFAGQTCGILVPGLAVQHQLSSYLTSVRYAAIVVGVDGFENVFK